jgi:anti-sigma regulatory factor (Ser/Thr protein kinase)
MAPSRQPDVLLGVYEVVSNSLKQGVAAEVSHWRDGRTVVWQVQDDGPGLHDALAGYAPPGPDLDSGRGLWIARGIADDLSVRATGPGTAVRLYFDDVQLSASA